MRRVAVIGNSHLGALKRAWDAGLAKRQPELELVFFGSPRRTIASLRATGDALTTDDAEVRRSLALTSGKADPKIRLPDYDAILLHALIGLNWAIPQAIKLNAFVRATGSVVSSGLVQDLLRNDLRKSVFQHVLEQIRSISRVPIVASTQPFLSEDSPHLAALSGLSSPLLPEMYEEFIERQMQAVAVDFLPQNAVTVTDRCFTRRVYSVNGCRLRADTTGAPSDDLRHMNESYGRTVIDDLLVKLRTSPHWGGASGQASAGTAAPR
jgi:hypothetical protein